RHLPDAAVRHEPRRAAAFGVLGDAHALDLLELLEQLEVDSRLVDDVARGVGCRERLGAELVQLLDRVDRDIARARHDRRAPLETIPAGREHLLQEEHGAVAGRLGAHLGAAPLHALAGEHPRLVAVGDLAVLAEQVADLARAHADVARGNVGVLAGVAVELGHEALREALDLAVAAAVRVEVAAALGSADALAGEGVLEDLLEAEELDDAEVDARVEAQTALVGAERGVELHTESAVHLHRTRVVDPRDAEHDLPLGFDESLEDPCLEVFGMLLEHRSDRLEHLVERLVEFGFARVAGNGGAEDVVDVSLNVHVSKELSAVERRGADVAERAGPLRRRRSRRNAAPEVVGSMASC